MHEVGCERERKGLDLTKTACVGEGCREAGIGGRDLCQMGLILLANGGRRDDGRTRRAGRKWEGEWANGRAAEQANQCRERRSPPGSIGGL